MDNSPTPAELEAARYITLDNAFKAAGQASALMLAALQDQHPDRAAALNQSLANGVHLAVQFRFGPDAKAVLQAIDVEGNAIELAAVPVVIRDPNDKRSN